MKQLQAFWRWLTRRWRRSTSPTQNRIEAQPFRTYADHYTTTPRLPYTTFAYGTLPHSQQVARHYWRVRPFMGSRDPALFESVPNRHRLARTILAATLSPENKRFWQALLGNPPTHVVRLGFTWQLTGEAVDILYLPVSLSYPNHSADALAREIGAHLVELLRKERLLRVLCPTPERMRTVALFWLSMVMLRWRWLVRDRYHLG